MFKGFIRLSINTTTQGLLSKLLRFMAFSKGSLLCSHAMSTLEDTNGVYMSNSTPSTLVFSRLSILKLKNSIKKYLSILCPLSIAKINCILQLSPIRIKIIKQTQNSVRNTAVTKYFILTHNLDLYWLIYIYICIANFHFLKFNFVLWQCCAYFLFRFGHKNLVNLRGRCFSLKYLLWSL